MLVERAALLAAVAFGLPHPERAREVFERLVGLARRGVDRAEAVDREGVLGRVGLADLRRLLEVVERRLRVAQVEVGPRDVAEREGFDLVRLDGAAQGERLRAVGERPLVVAERGVGRADVVERDGLVLAVAERAQEREALREVFDGLLRFVEVRVEHADVVEDVLLAVPVADRAHDGERLEIVVERLRLLVGGEKDVDLPGVVQHVTSLRRSPNSLKIATACRK